MRTCAVRGCGAPHRARGWCRAHYRRWQRHGDPLTDVPIRRAAGSYSTARQRVAAARGRASEHACAACGARASHWSYDGTDPHERRDPRGRRYSLDPGRYQPSCRSCVRRPKTLDIQRAARLYRVGASARAIGRLLDTGPEAVLTALRHHGVPIRSTRGRRATAPSQDQERGTQPQQQPRSTPVHPDPMVCAASPDRAAAKIHSSSLADEEAASC